MGIEQRVRNYKRAARHHYYSVFAEYGWPAASNVTNWRMLIARRFGIPISRVREILGEPPKPREPHRG